MTRVAFSVAILFVGALFSEASGNITIENVKVYSSFLVSDEGGSLIGKTSAGGYSVIKIKGCEFHGSLVVPNEFGGYGNGYYGGF